MRRLVAPVVGSPVVFEELKHKPGRRLTLRARGPRGTAIVKLYRSDRIARVAERIAALADGPPEPEVPSVLAADLSQRILVLSDLAGVPLREAVLDGDLEQCGRAGVAIARWHSAWTAAGREPLSEHSLEDELATLADRAALAPREIGARVAAEASLVREAWVASTVVHRDLYEEQVLIGERVALIDLDDAALGPPELDVGNLVAHLDLLELRTQRDLGAATDAFLDGYRSVAALDDGLLARCRTLTRLRLACIHGEPRLLDPVSAPTGAAT